MNYFKSDSTRSNNSPKKGLLQLNLLVFSLVALVIALVSYQVGRDISSQLILTNQQTGGQAIGADVVEIATPVPATPTAPIPSQGQLPGAVVPTSNRGNTIQNPTPAVSAPPVPVKPTTTVAAKVPAPKATPKPVPTTKGS